jgi:hypothetical protein
MTRTDRKWRHRKSWTGNNFPVVFPELLYILGTNNGILNPTNRSPSDIWIPPIVALLASSSKPTNRRPSDIWIPPIVALLASNTKPTNRQPSDIWITPMVSLLWTYNRQPSVVRSSIWKSHFRSIFHIDRTGRVYLVENLYIIYIIKGYDWWDSNIGRATIGWIQIPLLVPRI